MNKPAPLLSVLPAIKALTSNDVSSLYSQFSAFTQDAGYKEVVREEVAQIAIERWPLLAELYGDDLSPLKEKTSA